MTLWRGGLRTEEALGLRLSDLDPARGLIRVRGEVAKGGKPRMVGLDPEAFAVVNVWLVRRRLLAVRTHARLFCTLRGSPLDAGYCRAMLKRAVIQERVHLHGLRHSHAVERVREGIPLPQVQAQLGHSPLTITSRYLSHVTPEDLANQASQRPQWDT